MLRRRHTRIAVVGGGISGLSAAHHLLESGATEVRIFEASTRPGGLVRTERHGELLLEYGPDGVVAAKPAGVELCRRVGLDDQILHPRPRPAGLEIVRDGRLVRLPDGLQFLAPTRLAPLARSRLLSWRGKLRAAAERFVPPRRADGDESLREFATRRFGRELFERVAEPIVAGLYTADADSLSVDAALPRLRELERRFGSVTRGVIHTARGNGGAARRGPSGIVTLRDGMESLVDGIVARLPAGCLAAGEPVEALGRDRAAGGWWIDVAGAGRITADAVILALPAHASAALLRRVDATLATELAAVRHASCATIHLAYRRSDLTAPLSSYGFFVPRLERLPLVACSFASEKFQGRAPATHVLFRAFVGGALGAEVLERDDEALAELVHLTLAALLPLGGVPTLARVHRCPESMPQFDVGHRERLARTAARLDRHPGLFLCGAATGALGIPDCVESGTRAASGAVDHLARGAERVELAI